MSAALVAPVEISADAAMSEYYSATAFSGGPFELLDIAVKMKTHTAGLGTLLVTVRYDDGEGPQDLNVALALTAGNYSVATWPNIWRDTSVNIQAAFQYLVPGGTCDVEVLVGRE